MREVQRPFPLSGINNMRLLRESAVLYLECQGIARPATLYTSPKRSGKPFALSRVFLLFSEEKSAIPAKEKMPSRNDFSASMHVVLKTRHVNPNIHVRRYLDLRTWSKLICHSSTTIIIPTRSNNLIEVKAATNMGSYHRPIRQPKLSSR